MVGDCLVKTEAAVTNTSVQLTSKIRDAGIEKLSQEKLLTLSRKEISSFTPVEQDQHLTKHNLPTDQSFKSTI